MSTLSPRLLLNLPDDGGAGGDDVVDVTTQLSNNFTALDGAVGVFRCTSVTRPITGNFAGRLIHETDTDLTFEYDGAAWILFNNFAKLVISGAPIVGAFNATKPTKIWVFDMVVNTNAAGDATIMTAAQIGAGCVLSAFLISIDVYNITAAFRNVGGNLTARIFNSNAAMVSGGAACMVTVIGQ